MKSMLTKLILPAVSVGLLVYAIMFVGGQDQALAPAAPAMPPPESPFEYAVAGAGLIEAKTENISIGSAMAGVVTKVHIKVGQKVAAGDPLFELDDRELQAELQNRAAALVAAEADFRRMENEPRPEELRMAQARLLEARADEASSRDTYNRARGLYAKKVETAETVIARKQALAAAEARVALAQAEYDMREKGAWQYDLDIARASVKQAQARVAQTETELERLVVRSPVAGRVLADNVRPGEFVGTPPGQALIVLGAIDQLHVRVDIDENDIPRFQPGASGLGVARGQSGAEYPLTFVRVEPYVVPKQSLTGDNTERVDTRVLQVIYAIEPGGQPLYVGQQLDVYIEAPAPADDAASTPLARAKTTVL